MRDALLRPPCGVAFSGGRDSSAVLAVATHVARRDGLPEPVPITKVYSGVADADEAVWQEMVVRHLGLQEWHRIDIHDELDLVGPIARQHLVEHGVMWPPPLATDAPLLEPVQGGSLIDGEGGDEVFGDAVHRIAPVARLVRHPRPLRWRRVARWHRVDGAGAAPAPPDAGVLEHRRDAMAATGWKRPPALRDGGRRAGAAPLSFAVSVRLVPRQRQSRAGGEEPAALGQTDERRRLQPAGSP